MGKIYLTIKQRNILRKINKIKELNKYDFYLAGGVGLAFYLFHRFSMDLDFFQINNLNRMNYTKF